ncbi:trypsinogen-like protein 3 [Sardina pilchardus]|uniref:trypsinogen-like protein 3 n=1 Tax=Sardina pilchardus TaxID=27697 RepID=UPI002E167935
MISTGVSVGTDCSPFARPWLVSLSNVDDLTGQSDPEQRISVGEWINRSKYTTRHKRSPVTDLELVRLAWSARFTPQVQPIALPTRCPQPGERCVVSGWGPSDPGTGSRKQQCLVREVLSESACRQAHGYWTGNLVCTGPQHTTECNCLRDDSSVLECGGVLQGVKGFVFLSEGCSTGKPDTFSPICQYRSWIDAIMSTNTPTVGPQITSLPMTPTTASTSTILISAAWPFDDLS